MYRIAKLASELKCDEMLIKKIKTNFQGEKKTKFYPYPIYDQNLWFSLPYLWPDQKFD